MKDSFVFYKSFYDSIHRIKDKELKADIFEAICELALYKNNIELSSDVGLMIMDLIKPQIEANNKRYEDGKKGGRPKKLTSGYIEEKTSGYENEKPNVNGNDNVNVNDNKKKIVKEKSFTKPSLKEIQVYCKERNNSINAEQFYDFYESKNWMVGKNKMKDWKACVRTWEQRENKNNTIPEWMNKKFTKEAPSEEEAKELEELLKEFK